MYALGVDIGSTTSKAVIMEDGEKIVSSSIVVATVGTGGVLKAVDRVLNDLGMTAGDIDCTVATGYGRQTYKGADFEVSELTCHALGAHYIFDDVRTVIDIGGQDAKVLSLNDEGRMVNFVMNDKCAAGTGRFLELMARTLEMPLEKMGRLGLEWKNEIAISSMCTVFAESEVVSLIANNTQSADIIHGLNMAVAGKTASLAKRLGGGPRFIMTGGVAQNPGVVKALEEKLGSRIYVPKEAQLCGAIGAALIALEGQDGDA